MPAVCFARLALLTTSSYRKVALALGALTGCNM